MADLISRDAAINICKSVTPNTNPDFYNLRSKKGYGCWMHSNGEAVASTSIQVRLENLPAVDAVPVVHGRWMDIPDKPEWDQKMCSICGDYFCCQVNYCPNCGAKMDDDQSGAEYADNPTV